jgi:hypothetical protein
LTLVYLAHRPYQNLQSYSSILCNTRSIKCMHFLAWSLAGYWCLYKIISLASLIIENIQFTNPLMYYHTSLVLDVICISYFIAHSICILCNVFILMDCHLLKMNINIHSYNLLRFRWHWHHNLPLPRGCPIHNLVYELIIHVRCNFVR